MPEEKEISKFEYKIEINGEQLKPEMRNLVLGIEFVEEINCPSMFRIQFKLTDMEGALSKLLSLTTLNVGAEVKLYMGSETPELMMAGEITVIEPRLTDYSSEIEVRGFDKLHRLKLGRKTKTYLEMKDSDLVSELAGAWGLQVEADPTTAMHPHIFQNNVSDYEFLKERAMRLRYEIKVEDKKLLFKKAGESVSPELTLEYGVDFTVFSASYGIVYAGDQVDVKGWDYVKKEVIEASAKPGNEVSKMEAKETGAEMTKKTFVASSTALVNEMPVDKAEAEVLAEAEYNHHLVETVSANIQAGGNPAFRVSKTVQLSKLGSFNGSYYIHKTTHTWGLTRVYTTDFQIRRTGL